MKRALTNGAFDKLNLTDNPDTILHTPLKVAQILQDILSCIISLQNGEYSIDCIRNKKQACEYWWQ